MSAFVILFACFFFSFAAFPLIEIIDNTNDNFCKYVALVSLLPHVYVPRSGGDAVAVAAGGGGGARFSAATLMSGRVWHLSVLWLNIFPI